MTNTTPQTTTIRDIAPADACAALTTDRTAKLIDVRTAIEFAEVHAASAVNLPLDQLDAAALARQSQDCDVYLICKSGARAGKACEALLAAGGNRIHRIAGGTDAWSRAGLPVERREVISLERQVRIAAGTLVLIGVILGTFVNHWFYGLSAFVGAGLVFAGISNFCGMGLLLAKAPWNKGCATQCANKGKSS